MDKIVFIAGLGALFAGLLWWSRRLPGERWQIAAAIPVGESHGGRWRGSTLPFTACSPPTRCCWPRP